MCIMFTIVKYDDITIVTDRLETRKRVTESPLHEETPAPVSGPFQHFQPNQIMN